MEKWSKSNCEEPCISSRNIFRLVGRHWQPFKYSDKRVSLWKMYFGGILAYQSKLDLLPGVQKKGALKREPYFIHSSWKEVVMLGTRGRNGLVEGFFCLAWTWSTIMCGIWPSTAAPSPPLIGHSNSGYKIVAGWVGPAVGCHPE